MKHGFIIFCLASIFVFSACAEGEYNDLDCDTATYKANCIDSSNFMWCNNGKLIVTQCSSQAYCSERLNEPASCVEIK